jgi:hypothetical protein
MTGATVSWCMVSMAMAPATSIDHHGKHHKLRHSSRTTAAIVAVADSSTCTSMINRSSMDDYLMASTAPMISTPTMAMMYK